MLLFTVLMICQVCQLIAWPLEFIVTVRQVKDLSRILACLICLGSFGCALNLSVNSEAVSMRNCLLKVMSLGFENCTFTSLLLHMSNKSKTSWLCSLTHFSND